MVNVLDMILILFEGFHQIDENSYIKLFQKFCPFFMSLI